MFTDNDLSLKDIDTNTLVELSDVDVDCTATVERRTVDFLRKIKNPYLFKVHGKAVKVVFVDSSDYFQERLTAAICNIIANKS